MEAVGGMSSRFVLMKNLKMIIPTVQVTPAANRRIALKVPPLQYPPHADIVRLACWHESRGVSRIHVILPNVGRLRYGD